VGEVCPVVFAFLQLAPGVFEDFLPRAEAEVLPERGGGDLAAVEYDPLDLITFISKNFIPLNTMMERAGMSEMDIYHRTRDIFLYFKLPYDSEPPEE
jgi:hypothetical protein